jgi:hypothetical protein
MNSNGFDGYTKDGRGLAMVMVILTQRHYMSYLYNKTNKLIKIRTTNYPNNYAAK